MSTYLEFHEPFGYSRDGQTNTCIAIGMPLRGHEHYGQVRSVSTHNGYLHCIGTEKPCPADPSYRWHLLDRKDERICSGCGLVIQPEPAHTFGFFSVSNIETGEASYGIDDYDADEHGPHGAATFEEAIELAEQQMTLMRKQEGNGPWFVFYMTIGDQERIDVSTAHEKWSPEADAKVGYDGCFHAYAGPYADVRDARKAAWLVQQKVHDIPDLPAPWVDRTSQYPSEDAA